MKASGKIWGAITYVAFLALFAEIVLQAFYYATAGDFLFRRASVPIWARNEYSGIFNRPNLSYQHHTNEFTAWCYNNAEGFRVPQPGIEFSREKPAGTYRVMLLGPSFAYGWGVDYERTFGAILERELEERGYAEGRHIQVINAGVPSLAAAAQLRWYDHVGRDYHPDLVIQFVYGTMVVSNDPVMNAEVDEHGYLVPRDASTGQRIRAQLKKSATVFYGWTLWTRLATGLGSKRPTGVLGAGREMSSHSTFDVGLPDVAEALEFYDDLQREVRRDGTDLLVVYFPLSYAIHREDVARWKHLGVTDVPGQIAFDARFADHLNGRGIPVVNATPSLQRAAEAGERLYYWLDIHWTAKGNEVAARAVADHLVDSGPRRSR